jgi:hypothetical protein
MARLMDAASPWSSSRTLSSRLTFGGMNPLELLSLGNRTEVLCVYSLREKVSLGMVIDD